MGVSSDGYAEATILLLLEHDANRDKLASWLDRDYQVVSTIDVDPTERTTDLCILDEETFRRRRDLLSSLQDATSHSFYPFLFVSNVEDADIPEHVWNVVDDVLTTPTRKHVLDRRVNNLLERRRMSRALSDELAHERAERAERERHIEAFEEAFENAGHAIFVTSKDGIIEYVNGAFESITGYSRMEAVGATPKLLEPDQGDADGRPALDGSTLEDGHWSGEMVNERKDDERYVAHQTISAIRDNDGEVERYVAVHRDVSAQRERQDELERRLDQLSRTERQASVGGWELDVETRALQWTDGTRRVHEVSANYDPTLADALEFYDLGDRSRIQRFVERCLETGEPFDAEARIETAAQRKRWVRTRGELVESDDEPTLRGVIQDVTDRKLREQRLTVHNRVLRHNLRNDLNSISGYARLLAEKVSAADPSTDGTDAGGGSERALVLDSAALSDVREYTRTILESAENVMAIGEKLQRLEKTLSEDQPNGPVEVRPVVERLVESFGERYADASIAVTGGDEASSVGEEALELAVSELLENAVEHADRCEPTVTVDVSTGHPGHVLVSVIDDGPGLPEMEREVLDREEETPLLHGSGTGLWVVKWLATLAGGTLDIADAESRGTIATLELPQPDP